MPDGMSFPGNGERPEDTDSSAAKTDAGADVEENSSNSDKTEDSKSDDGMPQIGELPDGVELPDDADFSDFKMGAMGGNGGADLNYTDDDLDSYSTIWDGEVTSSGKKDHKRVVEALKNISEGTDLETYMDVDNILKYMAVHTFVVNDDSLSGTMAHNYYLYEYNGRLNILPWDYNLSFGGMSMGGGMGGQSSDATSVINDAIDTPFSITDFFDALLENEEYLAKYHEYLNELAEKYVNGGEFQKTYERIRSQIDDLVADDPTAFYSCEEYEAAAEMLCKVVSLRAESVSGQLGGTIPSTDDGQQADSSSLIDGSDIDLGVMGTMSGGAGENVGGHEDPGQGPGGGQGFPGNGQPAAGEKGIQNFDQNSEEKEELQSSDQNSEEKEETQSSDQNSEVEEETQDSDGNEELQNSDQEGV